MDFTGSRLHLLDLDTNNEGEMEDKLSVEDLQRDTYTLCLTQTVQRVQSFLALRHCNYDRWTRRTWRAAAAAPQRAGLLRQRWLGHRRCCWGLRPRGLCRPRARLPSSQSSVQTYRQGKMSV